MTGTDGTFFAALRAALRAQPLADDPQHDGSGWCVVLRRAEEQQLLPLVYEAVCRVHSFRTLAPDTCRHFQEKAVSAAVRQIVQTNEFLTLMLHAQRQGLDPAVLKGVCIRSLYPMPMLRPSVDEDLLVAAKDAARFHSFLLASGLHADDADADPETDAELSYHKDGSPTYLELHTSLFAPDSDAYGDCNRFFEGALARCIRVQIEDVSVRTLAPTDHILYLILHAYKHFLHSGTGLRAACDIAMFAHAQETQIDWTYILACCKALRTERFAAALLRIAAGLLDAAVPAPFAALQVDEQPLLEDMLAGGALGASGEDRLHSSTITLEAVSAQKRGTRAHSWRISVFPPLGSMQGKYPYLRRMPWLLPAAWMQRLIRYLFRSRRDVSPAQSVRIGKSRVRLLREYGIID